MSKAIHGEPLLQESTRPSACCAAKILAVVSLLSGLACVVLWSQVSGGKPHLVGDPAITTAQVHLQRQPARTWQPMLPVRAGYSVPARAAAGAVDAGPSTKAWIATWKAKQSGTSGASNAAAPAAVADDQEALSKKFAKRQELGITLATFPVKALRGFKAQGTDVAEGTTGTLEGDLIKWDDGSYTDKLRSLSGVDWRIQKIAELAVDATAKPAAKKKLKEVMADGPTYDMLYKWGNTVMTKASDLGGVTAPMGYWDPLGFSTDISAGKLLFYREVELKHGRVGMLASLGILVGEKFHPLFGGDIDVPAYVAFQETPLQTFWQAVVLVIAIPEVFSIQTFDPDAQWEIKPGRVPGDFDWDPLGLKPASLEEFNELRTKELNNGRLAMIAAAGMIAQELVTGQKIFN